MKNDIGCLDAIEAFYAYLDGELDDPGSIADFEHHLEHCRSCFTRIEMEKMLSERMRRSARRESPQALRERVNKLMERFGEDSSG
ncbi:MAG: zf-HC2 domain-containing protein [Woeseiaceae bacterium]|jgi:anti-sigma factor (TIGR02949 family)